MKTYMILQDDEDIVSERGMTLDEANFECKQFRLNAIDGKFRVVEDPRQGYGLHPNDTPAQRGIEK